MKRTLSAAVAVILAVVTLLCSCSNEGVTEQQYLDELTSAFRQYKDAIVEINELINAEDYDIDKINTAAKTANAALDKTEKLKVPSGYEDYQERLIKSLDAERKFISLNVRICEYGKKQQDGTLSEEDTNKLAELTNELSQLFGDDDEETLSSSYPAVMLDLVKKLKEAGCTVSTYNTES